MGQIISFLSARIGTSVMLRVMAGDRVEMNVSNFYDSYAPGEDDPVSMEDMLGSIVGTLSGGVGAMAGESHDTKAIGDLLTTPNFDPFYSR